MSRLLFPDQRNALVCGYIRQNIVIFVPMDLEKLCYKYYNDIIDWTLTGKALQEFFESKHDELLNGPTFNVISIPFQLIAYPNRCINSSNEGYISVYLQLLQDILPPAIIQFTIYAHLFCSVARIAWKKAITLKYLRRTNGKRTGWFRYNMKLQQYLDYKSITFCCYAELIDIKLKYKSDKLKSINNYNMNKVSMDSQCDYEWNIDNDLLNAFKTSNSGQCYYSPNFNNGCFCIVIIPQGRVTDKYGSFRTFIKLLKLPNNISNIMLKCTINVIAEHAENKMDYMFEEKLGGLRKQIVASSTLFYVPNSHIFESQLLIRISMEVTHVFDADTVIDTAEWHNFNITTRD